MFHSEKGWDFVYIIRSRIAQQDDEYGVEALMVFGVFLFVRGDAAYSRCLERFMVSSG